MVFKIFKKFGRKIFFTFFSKAKHFWVIANRPINTERLEEIKEEQRKIQYYSTFKL
jgi:hypothetical protein